MNRVYRPCFGGCVITTREELAVQRGGGAHAFALAAAELAANTRCENVVLLDLRGKSPVTEYFVIATGTSPRQMRTVVDEIVDLGKQTGFTAWQQSGYESAKWIVLDCVNVVVHVFDVESRDFYDLELLWGDSPRVDWRKELGLPAEVVMPPLAEDEVGEAEATDLDAGGDADVDEEAETDLAVEMELPDESAGGVELVEIAPPSKRGQKGRDAFPTTVEEDADSTMEERSMGPLSEAGDAAASLDDDEAPGATPAPKKAARQVVVKGAKKKAVTKKKVAKKVAKTPAKKAAKKTVKKAAPKKAAKKAAVGKTAMKGLVKKAVAAAKRLLKKPARKRAR